MYVYTNQIESQPQSQQDDVGFNISKASPLRCPHKNSIRTAQNARNLKSMSFAARRASMHSRAWDLKSNAAPRMYVCIVLISRKATTFQLPSK